MHHEKHDRNREDWARRVDWERGRGPYRDYGWERGQSALPEFRDSSVRVQPYERERVGRWRNVQWDDDLNRGTWEVSGPYRGVGPKNYKRKDEQIFEEVCERLSRHGQLDARNINVEVKDGEVVLNGSVPDRRSRYMAEDTIDDIHGVRDVQNHLRVADREGRSGNQGQYGRESGMPGGGRGRTDEVGRSGVYPASGPMPEDRDAETRTMAGWGQGERGAEGYHDHGDSEINIQREEEKKQRRG